MELNDKKEPEFIQLTANLYDKCLEYIKQRRCSEKTKILYITELKKIFKSPILTQSLYSKIYSRGNYYKSILKLIQNTCEHFDIQNYNYKTIKPIKKPRHHPQVWQEHDILKMIDEVEEYGLLLACAYYIGAGLRFSSAILLSWDNFMWEDWLLDKTKTGKCDIHGKGDKEKVLQVDPLLMSKLYNIAKNRQKLFKNVPYKNFSDDKMMFVKQYDLEELELKFRKQNFENTLDSVNEEVNVKQRARIEMIRMKHYLVDYRLRKLSKFFNNKRVKFHSIRHSRATNLLKRGFKLLTIKEQLMHRSISTTEIYLNIEDVDIENEFNEKL